MRAVEAAVRACRGRAGELVDQVDEPEPGRNAQVARREPEQVDDLAVAPEERDDQRRAAVTPRVEVGASAGSEQELCELPVVPVAGLVELRPPVVVAAVHIRAALQEQPGDVEVAAHAEKVVAVRATLPHELRMLVEQRAQLLEIAVLDGAIRDDERRRLRLAARKCPHAAR